MIDPQTSYALSWIGILLGFGLLLFLVAVTCKLLLRTPLARRLHMILENHCAIYVGNTHYYQRRGIKLPRSRLDIWIFERASRLESFLRSRV